MYETKEIMLNQDVTDNRDVKKQEDAKTIEVVDVPSTDEEVFDVDVAKDVDADQIQPVNYELKTKVPLKVAQYPLPDGLESCGIYKQTRCNHGRVQVCDIYDTKNKQFVDNPDEVLKRDYLYERWYDLYQSIHGITVGRVFKQVIKPDTPEEEWSKPELFQDWSGKGDGAIWAGTALIAYVLRYANTGTEADYQRMVKKVKQVLRLFEVTDVPGHLARYFYCEVPNDIPTDDPTKILEHHNPNDKNWFESVPIKEDTKADLPDYLKNGFEYNGQHVDCKAFLRDTPSIDQYSAPLVGFALAWDLLKDDSLKQRIAYQVTCHLKKLKKMRIYNLQKNKKLLDSLKNFLMQGQLNLDPGDMDFTKLNEIIIYYVPMYSQLNMEDYDRSCPDKLSYDFDEEIDVSKPGYMAKLFNFVGRLMHKEAMDNAISLFMVPSVRGGDAIQMLLRGVMAYHMTGDPQYKEFVLKELIGREHALDTIDTAGAMVLPKWCRKFYGENITYIPFFGLMMLLDEGKIKDRLRVSMKTEFKEKSMKGLENAVFDLLYYLSETRDVDPELGDYVQNALYQVKHFGGNGGVTLDEPRRDYDLDLTQNTPPGIELEYPSEKDIEICEKGFDFMGIHVPGRKIDRNLPMAKKAVPIEYRAPEDYIWQRNPFAVKYIRSHGREQTPGVDLILPYWMARQANLITKGKGDVLVWKHTEQVCSQK